jgi:hypothetical protein
MTLQFAESIMSPGSKFYAPLYFKITKAIFVMAAHQVSPDHDPVPAPSRSAQDAIKTE